MSPHYVPTHFEAKNYATTEIICQFHWKTFTKYIKIEDNDRRFVIGLFETAYILNKHAKVKEASLVLLLDDDIFLKRKKTSNVYQSLKPKLELAIIQFTFWNGFLLVSTRFFLSLLNSRIKFLKQSNVVLGTIENWKRQSECGCVFSITSVLSKKEICNAFWCPHFFGEILAGA